LVGAHRIELWTR